MFSVGKSGFAFVVGFAVGAFLAFVTFTPHDFEVKPKMLATPRTSKPPVSERILYEAWSGSRGLRRRPHPLVPPPTDFKTESEFLFDSVSVTCVVLFKKVDNAYTAKYTWGQRCNRMVFYGDKKDSYLESNEVRSRTSWELLCRSLRHLWEAYRAGLEWVVVVPDDVFVIPENLRLVVAAKNASDPYYLGHNSVFWNQLYNSARAGFVLSLGALRVFASKFNSTSVCINSVKYNNNEDYYLGKFLSELGIRAGDGRDDMRRERFHGFTPAQLMAPGSLGVIERHSKRSLHPVLQGPKCCSPTSITFQGTEEDLIFLYSYLLYTVQVFRSKTHPDKPRKYTKSDQVWQRFVLDELGPDVNMSRITADLYYKMWSIKEKSPEEFNRKIRDEVMGHGH